MATGLQFSIEIEGLAADTFEMISFKGQEHLSEEFQYQVKLASEIDSISPDITVDRPVCLTQWFDGETTQCIHGIVQSFTAQGAGKHYSYYELTLVPATARLALRQNSRIFQDQTSQMIFETLFSEMGIKDYAFSLTQPLSKREFCVQYRESDLDFIKRIAAEEGMFYFFEHSSSKHTLVLSDSTQVLVRAESKALCNLLGSGVAEGPHINQFHFSKNLTASSVQLKDYSFKKPAYSFLHETVAAELAHQQAHYEHYDFPGRYKNDGYGKPLTQYRMEQLTRSSQLAHANSNIPGLCCGVKLDVIGHLEKEFNRDWVLVGMTQQGQQNLKKGPETQSSKTEYSNCLTLIPGHRPWRATANPKPRVDGPQMAKVTGPAGEEIFCDEFGRVKVQFPWDRYGQHDQDSSCWVRVAQGWAGAAYGMVAVPRIGHEVIVSFLEGDPDQPIITGRTYHASNNSPYVLPTNKTKTVIKTKTHKGSGFNELSFEDNKEQELIYLHAQKDHKLEIKHDQTFQIGNDREKHIGNDQRLTVGQDEWNEIGRDQISKIIQDRKLEVQRDQMTLINRHYKLEVNDRRQEITHANFDVQVDGDLTEKVNGKMTTQVGTSALIHTKTLTLNGSEKVIIQGPGGKIQIDSGGVTIESPSIKLKGPVAVSTGAAAQLATLDMAAAEGTPLADVCQECGG